MEDAAVTDLRGEELLPELLQVIGTPDRPDAGAGRERADGPGSPRRQAQGDLGRAAKAYADSDAIRIMDAWWPLLVKAEFQPGHGRRAVLGDDRARSAMRRLSATAGSEAGVSHKGSSFQSGWYSYVDKDLRAVLGQPVQGGLTQPYCGGGDLTQCRAGAATALATAAATPASSVYPADSVCSAGDQWCADSIQQRPLGGITDAQSNWQNRPTFQQVVQYPAHRGANVADLAAQGTATASSAQSGYPARNAVTGNGANRWASNWDDNEWLQVDLGRCSQVGRAILNWESRVRQGLRHRGLRRRQDLAHRLLHDQRRGRAGGGPVPGRPRPATSGCWESNAEPVGVTLCTSSRSTPCSHQDQRRVPPPTASPGPLRRSGRGRSGAGVWGMDG